MTRKISNHFVPSNEQSEKFPSRIIKTLLTIFCTKCLFLKSFLKLYLLSLQLDKRQGKEFNEDKTQVNKHGYFLADGKGIKFNLLRRMK